MRFEATSSAWTAAVVLWLVIIAAGFGALTDYAARPGDPGEAARTWPATSALERESGLPTLVLFAHPGCPCTRASLAELARLVAQSSGPLDAQVLLVEIAGGSNAEAGTARDLWERAASIPGVAVRRDRNGREAALFGAATSGQVLLYDAAGTLAFNGGITAARGHEGDSFGRAAIVAALAHEKPTSPETPVFGCSLRAPQTS